MSGKPGLPTIAQEHSKSPQYSPNFQAGLDRETCVTMRRTLPFAAPGTISAVSLLEFFQRPRPAIFVRRRSTEFTLSTALAWGKGHEEDVAPSKILRPAWVPLIHVSSSSSRVRAIIRACCSNFSTPLSLRCFRNMRSCSFRSDAGMSRTTC
jgi:hypothetical protein